MKCIKCGDEITTGNPVGIISSEVEKCNRCKRTEEMEKKQKLFCGWICPSCGHVHSPHVVTCPCNVNAFYPVIGLPATPFKVNVIER